MFAVDRSETNLQKAGRQLGITKEKEERGRVGMGKGEGLTINAINVLWRGGERERRDIGELKQASFIGNFASNLKRSYLFSVLN